MYILMTGLFILVLVFGFTGVSGVGIEALIVFIDIPSILLSLLFTLPFFAATGLGKDFLKGFKAVSKKNKASVMEWKRSYAAVSLFLKLFISGSLLSTVSAIIVVLSRLDDMEFTGPNLSVSFISLFYMLIGCFILIPVQYMIKLRILAGEE